MLAVSSRSGAKCVDFKKLNKAIKRPRFILPTPDAIYSQLRGSKIFTTLDATSGYWQLPLDAKSSELTTFITESGRYKFTRLPFGISLASEVYQREMSKILHDLPGCQVYQDDVVVHGGSMEEHDSRLGRSAAKNQCIGHKTEQGQVQIQAKLDNIPWTRHRRKRYSCMPQQSESSD